MRIWDRLRGSFLTDEVDPTLAELLPRQTEDTVDSFHLARVRARVDARLTETAQPHGGLLRRVALAAFGGGGMWAGLLSTVAANKAAAAAIGLSVLASGTVAEATGVGPAVRDAVAHTVTHEDDSAGGELLVEGTETATATPTETAETDEESNAAVSVSEGNPLPGNLVTHIGPNGRFELRAEIMSADGTMLVLTTSDGELKVDVSDADVVAAGNPADDVTWEDYVDYGVFVSGTCADEEPAELLVECADLEIKRVQLLGRAGQGGQPEDIGKPEGVGAASEGTGQPEGVGAPEGAGRPDDAGQPDGVGQPAETPTAGGRPTSGPGAPSD